MSQPKCTGRNVVKVLRKFADYLDTIEYAQKKEAAEVMQVALDSLLGEDFFGTEGQLDPRGDWRD